MLVTPSGAAVGDLNQPVGVNTLTQFTTKFPSAPERVLQAVKFFLLNNPDGQLQIYACNDAATTGSTPADLKQHLLTGIATLGARVDLELSYIICPEMATFTTQSDRTAIFSAIQSFCEKADWLFLVNTATATDTKAKAIAERALYSSAQGHSSIYYGGITDNENKGVDVAVAAAAIALKRDRNEPYSPPAGAKYPILGVKTLINYVDNVTDYNDLKAQQINVIQTIPKVGNCIWGAQTLSVDTKFSLLNTRLAISVCGQRLQDALTPILFNSTDPQGRTSREVDRVIITLLNNIWLEGGLSGETPDEAFKVEDIFVPANPTATTPEQQQQQQQQQQQTATTSIAPSLKTIKKRIFARFVEHVQQIEVGIFVVDVLPS
jgi:hypothetical protein